MLNDARQPISAEQAHAMLRKRRFGRVNETVIVGALAACAFISFLTTGAIIYVLFSESLTLFDSISLQDFFLETNWQPLFEPVSFGIWELVAGTVNVVIWSLILALPIGMAGAIYLSEYASPRTRRVLKPVIEALASVPTVVFAYFALTVITPDLLRPLLGDDISIFNSLAASIMLAVMILPTLTSISEDAMASVPDDLRQAAYGLGATRLEVAVRVVVPAALSGIIAAVLLSIARVIGETMIVAVAAGSTPNLTIDPRESIQTMTGYMLQVALGDAGRGTIDYQTIFGVGATLFLMTLGFNVAAHLLVQRFREVYE